MKTKKFTLIEVLTVMVIISILMGMMVAGAGAVRSRNASSKTIGLMKQIEMGLEQFRNDWGYYPQQAVAGPFNFPENDLRTPEGKYYLDGYKQGGWQDGYGSQFRYKCPGTRNTEKYDLWSLGQDQTDGTADDISNWTRN
jgi:type II secretion system protein G